jgi:hypothetical protein
MKTLRNSSLITLALATLALLVAAPVALADQVSGSVSIAGTDTWTTTSINFITGSSNTTADTGTFSVIPTSTNAVLDNFTFSPTSAAVGDVLFNITGGGVTTTLTIDSLTTVLNSGPGANTALVIFGTGVLTETGYSSDVVAWTLSSTDTPGTPDTIGYQLTADTSLPIPPGVPEPGTLSLFGTGLLGLAGMLRSRFSKAS